MIDQIQALQKEKAMARAETASAEVTMLETAPLTTLIVLAALFSTSSRLDSPSWLICSVAAPAAINMFSDGDPVETKSIS